jgi:hypothetical protein
LKIAKQLILMEFEELAFDDESSEKDESVNSEQIEMMLYEGDVDITRVHRSMPVRLLPDAEPPIYPVPPHMMEFEVPLEQEACDDSDSDDDKKHKKKKSRKKSKKKKSGEEGRRKGGRRSWPDSWTPIY